MAETRDRQPSLDDAVQFLKGVGPARARDFEKLEVRTVRDLLFTFPRKLSDRSLRTTIADAPVGEAATIVARPVDFREKRVRGGRMLITTVHFADDTGGMEVVWFNSPWIADQMQDEVMLYGKTKMEHGLLKMEHPQYEILREDADALSAGRIVPLYPCTGKLTQGAWRKAMTAAIESRLPLLEEILPEDLRQRDLHPLRPDAVRAMHFPDSDEQRQAAEARLVFDECLLMQLAILMTRRHHTEDLPGRQFRITPELERRILRLFPFRLTDAQRRAVKDIAADMASEHPMHRLLQGDVGSGKTAVALYAMLAAVANKAQVCLMAPTSLLARQHYDTLTRFLGESERSRVRVALLVGGLPERQRQALRAEIAAGAVDVLIATHAAVEENVAFRDLGLVIVDEQHKFGVRQRTALVSKGIQPDTLVMTATPIPRSLALTVYGDLDVTVIDELPPGRKPVKTHVPPPGKVEAVWNFVRRELTKGRQAFIVSPLVDESEELDVTSATEAFENLRAGRLSGFRLELLHGRMKREEQREIMDRFRAGEVDALVSTVVIEVGVDVPNATIMVVLHADRFGLAQLHQLRGRIGRGAEAGHFVLLADGGTPAARRRLEILHETSDGFRIAEEDLMLRGPGEFLGARQHGLPELKLVDIVRDIATIRQARGDAQRILEGDPSLTRDDHRPLRAELARLLGDRGREVGIG